MRPSHIASRLSVRVAAIVFVLGFVFCTAASVQAALTYEQIIMADNPSAYWRFEEASTALPAADTATGDGAQDGTYLGTATLVPGIVGQAVNVAPMPDYGGEVTAAGVNIGASFTLETWAISDTPNWNALGWPASSRGSNGYIMHTNPNQKSWTAYVLNSVGQHEAIGSHTPGDIQQWHHYAISYDASTNTGRMYFDGVLIATKSMSRSRTSGTITAHMGRDDYGPTPLVDRRGDGSLDEVAIYNSVLGADRIRAHFFAPSGLAAFSGPSDPNLDLSGHFVYAVNVGAIDPAYVGPTIGNATFTREGVPGVSINSENRLFPAWGSKPEYGSSADDDALEDIMHSIRYDSSGNTALPGVQIDLDVIPGNTYQLQLLFSENGATSRAFNIEIEGETLYSNLDLMAVTGPWSGSPPLGVVFTHTFEATDNQLNILLGPGTLTGFNRDAILNAFTLELVPEPSSCIILVLGVVALLPLGLRSRRRKRT